VWGGGGGGVAAVGSFVALFQSFADKTAAN